MTRVAAIVRNEKKPRVKKDEAAALVDASGLRVSFAPSDPGLFRPLTYLRMDITGALSKLTSNANDRVYRVVTRKVDKKPIAVGFDSVEIQIRHMGLSELWRRFSQKLPDHVRFSDSKTNRLFCVLLLGSANDRMDSHNLSKGFCDWLQDMAVVTNDRNLDILPIHRSDYGLGTDAIEFGTTTAVIACTRTHSVKKLLGDFGLQC